MYSGRRLCDRGGVLQLQPGDGEHRAALHLTAFEVRWSTATIFDLHACQTCLSSLMLWICDFVWPFEDGCNESVTKTKGNSRSYSSFCNQNEVVQEPYLVWVTDDGSG
ncbi:2-C-methyl-D-erythritol 2,4-cyclodiphosphate synthase [Striga asiatica]|uniref:2-C-methyl-D-erythritol 2,4-cyclodiphosphate synthase n=1 Tax=Striga asiatica TaxID=4170 RepID=A0A5A7PCD9_STRAF|nr:2-C-methyl-D-erythritol 2,4-cyclodiphosphate synthase [Striga asiatica]